MQSAEWREYAYLLFGGKILGVTLLFAIIYLCNTFIGTNAFAEDAPLTGNALVNPLNTVWTLVAAFLVFGMQSGFTMLEAGF